MKCRNLVTSNSVTFVAYFVEIGAIVQRLKETHPYSDIIKSQDLLTFYEAKT